MVRHETMRQVGVHEVLLPAESGIQRPDPASEPTRRPSSRPGGRRADQAAVEPTRRPSSRPGGRRADQAAVEPTRRRRADQAAVEPTPDILPAMLDDARTTTDRRVTLDQIRSTREVLRGRVHRTPLLGSVTAARVIEASSGVRLADGHLHLKAEHLQKTGSFKPRGALARLAALTAEERARGVITLSAGNAAQAYAWASAQSGVHCVVVMPSGAVRSKVEACISYGAEVVLHGAHVGETFERMEQLRDERGLVFVHPFDDPNVIAGNGSLGMELLEDLPEIDVAVVGVGGGGLISGVAAALKESRPGVRVYGVEPVLADALARAMAAGEVVRIQPTSVADGLGAPFAGDLDAGDGAALSGRCHPARRPDDPRRASLRPRTAQAGGGAGGRGSAGCAAVRQGATARGRPRVRGAVRRKCRGRSIG